LQNHFLTFCVVSLALVENNEVSTITKEIFRSYQQISIEIARKLFHIFIVIKQEKRMFYENEQLCSLFILSKMQ
jgi:hypothetical protein